jgi:hypothetical protein
MALSLTMEPCSPEPRLQIDELRLAGRRNSLRCLLAKDAGSRKESSTVEAYAEHIYQSHPREVEDAHRQVNSLIGGAII